MLINLIKVLLLSTLPVLELRGAIPLAINYYKLPVVPSYFFAVLGNILPAIFLLLYLKPFSDLLRKWKIFDIFFVWLFKRTRRHEKRYEKYGALFLLFFVAIPLPITGVWTGSVAAFLFGIRFWYAFPMMTGGVIIAGIVVTLANLGIINLINYY